MKITIRARKFMARGLILLSLTTLAYCQNEQLAGEVTTLGYCHSESPYYSAYADSTAALRPTGSATDPYIVCTAADLEQLSSEVAAGETFSSKYFEQRSDIDFSGSSNFTPIGTSSTLYFAGSYDGGGYTISNLTISLSGTDNVGLFGYIIDADLQNLTLDSTNITADKNTAGLVGVAKDDSSIQNCHIKNSNIAGTEKAGGLIGLAVADSGNLVITKNSSSATISASSLVAGGVLGRANGHGGAITISENSAVTTVSAPGAIGGLIGLAQSNGSDVAITANSATPTLTITASGSSVGGLIGLTYAEGTYTVTVSKNAVDVNISTTNGSQAGGLVGSVRAAFTTVNGTAIFSSNLATGSISADDGCGGIAGYSLLEQSGAIVKFIANYSTVNLDCSYQAGAAFGYLDLNGGALTINSVYALGSIVTTISTNVEAFIGRREVDTGAGASITETEAYYLRGTYSQNGTPTTLANTKGGSQIVTLDVDMQAATGTVFTCSDISGRTIYPSGTIDGVSAPWSEFTFTGTGYPTL